MKNLYKIFKELENESPINEEMFSITSIPTVKNHKLGISNNGLPIFFIKCVENTKLKPLDVNLEFISVQFSRKCELANNSGKIEEGIYTLILLKNESEFLQEYFLKIVFVILKNISETPVLMDLKIEVEKLIILFTKFSKPALKTIQGLWAELLLIEQSNNPDYLIESWHSSANDKYDFNDGIDKLEVKSTSQNRRIHNFSLEQLIPNLKSRLIISSIFIVETGTGTSIFDLVETIESKVINKNLIYRLNEMVVTILGKDFEKSFDVFFDYRFAVDSILYYDSVDIPVINSISIPPNIMNLRFDCDLTNVNTINKEKIKSKLHKSVV